VANSPTVNLTLTGSGTAGDPFILTAHAVVSMSELADVNDPAGPAVGEAPVWNGSAWVFGKPAVATEFELAAADDDVDEAAPTEKEG